MKERCTSRFPVLLWQNPYRKGHAWTFRFCWLDYKERILMVMRVQFYEYFNRFIAKRKLWCVEGINGRDQIGWKDVYRLGRWSAGTVNRCRNGRDQKVHIFATTLGVSSLIYAEAFPNEEAPCFYKAVPTCCFIYGAVTKYFVPRTNCCNQAHKDELILQSTFAESGRFLWNSSSTTRLESRR